jgi:hypothetical protein
MSSFSLSTIQKAVDPAEVTLRKEWEVLSKKLVAAIASLPGDAEGGERDQAEWMQRWQVLVVSDKTTA